MLTNRNPYRLEIMVQQFVVQIQDAPDTRWLASAQEIQDRLAQFTGLLMLTMTLGPRPNILVVHVEQRQPKEPFDRRG